MASHLPISLGHELRRPDSQGRIIIGKGYTDKLFSVEPQTNGDIVLRPVVAIHEREAWLFANPEALASVKRGLEQSAAGQVVDLGSFEEFASDDLDDED